MGEPDVGHVLQSKAAAKQSQTRRSGTGTKVECEGLAGVVSLVVEGIELRLRLKLAGLIDHSKVKTLMVLPVFSRVKLDSDMSNSFRFQYEKKERKEISDEKDFYNELQWNICVYNQSMPNNLEYSYSTMADMANNTECICMQMHASSQSGPANLEMACALMRLCV